MWQSWIRENWVALVRGAKLSVPPSLVHPALVGFKQVRAALPLGQVADWALPLPDGSRVHIHQMKDGAFVAHRDVHDPDLGPLSLIKHLWHDTPFGVLALVGAALYASAS